MKKQGTEPAAASDGPKGSPPAILAAFDTTPHGTKEDVDAFMEAIAGGRRAVRFKGLFDPKEPHP